MELRLEEPYAKLWKEYEELYSSRPEYDEQVRIILERASHKEEQETAAKYPRMYSEIYNTFVKLKRIFKVKDISIIADSYGHNLVCVVRVTVDGVDYYTSNNFNLYWHTRGGDLELLEVYLQDTANMFSEMILKGE